MKNKQKSFVFYDDDIKCIEYLSVEQVGLLFQAIAASRLGKEMPDISNDQAVSILFLQISNHIKINEEKYRLSCERNAKAAQKRWQNKNMQSNASASECIKKNANGCYNDNDNDIDIDIDNDNDIDNVNDIDNDIDNEVSALNSGSSTQAPAITVDTILEKYRKIIAERAFQ